MYIKYCLCEATGRIIQGRIQDVTNSRSIFVIHSKPFIVYFMKYNAMDYNHTKILQVRLKLLEEYLRNIMIKLNYSNEESFVLYSYKNSIRTQEKIEVLKIVSSMLEEFQQMKKDFRLEPDEISVKQYTLGYLSEIWTVIEETRPETLIKNYGKMSNDDKELLNFHILKLLRMVDEIRTTLV